MSRGRLPFLAIVAVLASTYALAQGPSKEIAWRTDLLAGRQEAGQTGRNLLVHFWAPWCGPCRRLESTVFNQPAVAAALGESVVPVKLNADEFPQIAQAYGVDRLPTDVILAPNGTVLAKFASPQDPSAYLARIAPFGPAGRSQEIARVSAESQPGAEQFAPTVPVGPPQATVQPAYAQLPESRGIGQGDYTGPSAGVAPHTAANTTGTPSSTAYGTAAPAYGSYGTYPDGGTTQNVPVPTQQPVGAIGAYGSYGQYGSAGDRYSQEGLGQPSVAPATPSAAGSGMPLDQGLHPGLKQAPAMAASNLAEPRNVAATPGLAGGFSPSAPAGATAPAARPALGLDGYCPVTLKQEQRWVPGDKRYGIVHRGCLYLFAGPAQQQQFWAQPDNYSPALSGIDPVLALDNGATVHGQRDHGVEYNGMVYLFSSESTLQHFSRNPERYAAGVRQAMQVTGGTALR
jgi:protein disulfide-isomerase